MARGWQRSREAGVTLLRSAGQGWSVQYLQLHRADEDDVVGRQRPRLTGVEAPAVDERAVEAVQVLDRHQSARQVQKRVSAGRPDAIGGFLVAEVDLHH